MPTSLLPLSSNHQQRNLVLSPNVKEDAQLSTMDMSIYLTETKILE